MEISEDPLERRKWMLKLWREDYGARFSVFDPDDQPAPEMESWLPDMWEPYNPKPDQEGNYDPTVIRHLRWFPETKQFLRARYQVVIGSDLFFDCKAMQCQGRFTEKIPYDKERLWYLRALRIGAFLFEGKLGVGFSCRSLKCQRKKCPLNIKNKKRLNRVDIYQLLQILEGKKAMPLVRVVEEVSNWFDLPVHGFGRAHYAVPKQAVYRQIKLYQKNIPTLIKNFSNLCKRSPRVYFDMKPPTDKVYENHFFFPEAILTEGTLSKINSPAIVTYLYLWMLKMEQAQQNRFQFELPAPAEIEKDSESRGFKISRRSIERHIALLDADKSVIHFLGSDFINGYIKKCHFSGSECPFRSCF